MAATFMDFNKQGVNRKDLSQWQQIRQSLCEKFIKFKKNLDEKFEQLAVLITGFFGLQNGIFGKFSWFFSFANIWKRLNTCKFDGTAQWSVLQKIK